MVKEILTGIIIIGLKLGGGGGINFDTQLNGKLEKQSTTYDISRENLGTETYIVIGVDYRFKITKRLLLIPELKFLYNVSVKGSNVFENHVNIGAGYILNFSGG